MLRLEKERKKRKLNKTDVARGAEIDQAAYGRIERQIRDPYKPEARRLSEFFNIPAEKLFQELGVDEYCVRCSLCEHNGYYFPGIWKVPGEISEEPDDVLCDNCLDRKGLKPKKRELGIRKISGPARKVSSMTMKLIEDFQLIEAGSHEQYWARQQLHKSIAKCMYLSQYFRDS